jgi:hypothetical protein
MFFLHVNALLPSAYRSRSATHLHTRLVEEGK